MNKKITFFSIICIIFIFCFLSNIHAYTIYDQNNPGTSYTGETPSSATSGTFWPNNPLKAIRIRVFRSGSSVKSGYFSLPNSDGNCSGNISNVIVCYTEGYDYPNRSEIETPSCTSSTNVQFKGCLSGNSLHDTWDVNSSNGSYLDNYLKNDSYSNLKSLLKGMGYDESNFNNNDVVIVEPATLVYCAGDKYFGTANALKSKNVSYQSGNSNVCKESDNTYNGIVGGTFWNVYNSMTSALKTYSCTSSNYSGCGYFQYNVSELNYSPKYSLTINKIDASNGNSSQSGVTFTISGNGISKSDSTSSGTLTFKNLPNGTYTITETVPRGYASTEIKCAGCDKKSSGNQLKVTINGGNKTITVTNNKTCQSEFDALSDSDKTNPIERIKLYEKYNFKNLLNFSNTTNPCSNTDTDGDTCKPQLTIGCLSAETKLNNFSSTNVSCYKETIQVGNLTGYCGFTFNLNNNLGGDWGFTLTYKFEGNFKSGQMVLNRNFTDRLIAVGELKKTCYVYGSSVGTVVRNEEKPDYSYYINDIKFDDKTLDLSSIESEGWKKESNSNYATFTKIYEAKYSLLPVYSANGGGKIQNEECDSDNCKLLGYGFATKLNTPTSDRTTGPKAVEFTLNITKYFKDNVSQYTMKKACKYEVKNEILELPQSPSLTSDLNIEFRIIDTAHPFPGKSGQERTPGSNWRLNNNIEDFDFNKDGVVTLKDVSILRKIIGGAESLPETISNIEVYDINKNGKLDIKDAFLIQEITQREVAGVLEKRETDLTNNSYNKLADSVMYLTNNSYNKNGTGPKYTITLTSDTIKEIRNYNRTNSYDDYNLTCDENGYNCESTFLKDLKEGIVNGNPVSSILVDIEEETGKFNWNPEKCGECLIGNSISIFDYKKTN